MLVSVDLCCCLFLHLFLAYCRGFNGPTYLIVLSFPVINKQLNIELIIKRLNYR